jgi:hypothetical protein
VCFEQFTVKEVEVLQIADKTGFPANADCRTAREIQKNCESALISRNGGKSAQANGIFEIVN